jgi:hypothetical protein
MKSKLPKHVFLVIVSILLLGIIISQGIFDWHFRHRVSSVITGQPVVVSLIESDINDLLKPAPVLAQTGQVYLPDVKLMLPPPDQNNSIDQLVYINANAVSPLDLEITTRQILSGAEDKFLVAQAAAENTHQSPQNEFKTIMSKVPNLQACAEAVQLYYSAQNENGSTTKLQFMKKLDNGKTIYVYSETACSAEPLPALISYLKQIQSY